MLNKHVKNLSSLYNATKTRSAYKETEERILIDFAAYRFTKEKPILFKKIIPN